jgi:hypothetical protein
MSTSNTFGALYCTYLNSNLFRRVRRQTEGNDEPSPVFEEGEPETNDEDNEQSDANKQ